MKKDLEALHKEAVQKIGHMPDIKYWLIRAYDLGEKASNQDMSELDQDCPYCDIHSSCSIHADNQK